MPTLDEIFDNYLALGADPMEAHSLEALADLYGPPQSGYLAALLAYGYLRDASPSTSSPDCDPAIPLAGER